VHRWPARWRGVVVSVVEQAVARGLEVDVLEALFAVLLNNIGPDD
jgi:hypothetical protein